MKSWRHFIVRRFVVWMKDDHPWKLWWNLEITKLKREIIWSNLHDLRFQPFIFSEIPGIASFGEVVVKSKGKPCPLKKWIFRKHSGLGIHTLPKFNSSPLKSYCTPIGKDCLPFPPFFRGELLNFRACTKILPQKFYVKKLEIKTFATLTWERGKNVGFLTQRFFSGVNFLRFLQDWICWVGNFFAMGWKSQFFTTIWENMFFACAPLGQSTKSIISAVAGVWWQVLLDKSWTPWSRWEWRRSYGSISRILWSMLIEYCFGQSGIPRQQGMSKLFSKLHTEVPLPRVPMPKTPFDCVAA